MYPERFSTGVRNTTIPNPAHLIGEGFEGDVSEYDFKMQSRNYLLLQKVLRENDTELGPIAALTFQGTDWASGRRRDITLTRFVACSKDGRLMWEKYEGNTAGGGQNRVYVAGRMLKLTTFLSMTPEQQRALLSWNPLLIALIGV